MTLLFNRFHSEPIEVKFVPTWCVVICSGNVYISPNLSEAIVLPNYKIMSVNFIFKSLYLCICITGIIKRLLKHFTLEVSCVYVSVI